MMLFLFNLKALPPKYKPKNRKKKQVKTQKQERKPKRRLNNSQVGCNGNISRKLNINCDKQKNMSSDC